MCDIGRPLFEIVSDPINVRTKQPKTIEVPAQPKEREAVPDRVPAPPVTSTRS